MLAAPTQFTTPGPIIAVAAVSWWVTQILEGFVPVPYLVGGPDGLHPLSVIVCPDGVWPAVRFCRRAAGVTRQRSAAGRAARRYAAPAAGEQRRRKRKRPALAKPRRHEADIVIRIRHGSRPTQIPFDFVAPTPARL